MINPDLLNPSNVESDLAAALDTIKHYSKPKFVPKDTLLAEDIVHRIPTISLNTFETIKQSIRGHMQNGLILKANYVSFDGNVTVGNLAHDTPLHWEKYFEALGVDIRNLSDSFPHMIPGNDVVTVKYENLFDHEQRHIEEVMRNGKQPGLDIVIRPTQDDKTVTLVGFGVQLDNLDLAPETIIDIALAPLFPSPQDIQTAIRLTHGTNKKKETLRKLIRKYKETGVPLFGHQLEPMIPE